MDSAIHQQPTTLFSFNDEQDEIKAQVTKENLATVPKEFPSGDNFPSGLRGGGACFDCLACLCFCCVLEEIACLECCQEC